MDRPSSLIRKTASGIHVYGGYREYHMNQVKITLKNCYGIKALEKDLDFSNAALMRFTPPTV